MFNEVFVNTSYYSGAFVSKLLETTVEGNDGRHVAETSVLITVTSDSVNFLI